MSDLQTLRDQARLLADHVAGELENTANRFEHQRITQLAIEAETLVTAIDIFLGTE